MAREIQSADVLQISDNFAKQGIKTDFSNNKVIAWCCEKTANIFNDLNQRYDLNLELPKGIFVEDFAKLNINYEILPGFCTLAPTRLKANSSEITPEKTIFFNNFETALTKIPEDLKSKYNWNKINTTATVNYQNKYKSTDNFLEPFFNEFFHVVHLQNLMKNQGNKNYQKYIERALSKNGLTNYEKRYGTKVSTICDYAKDNPLEAVACDITKRTADVLDKKTLLPTSNPFAHSPYNASYINDAKTTSFIKSNKNRSLEELLNDFWNGKFD